MTPTSNSLSVPGTLKRTSAGALAAEIEWHRVASLREGRTITVQDTTATITGLGHRYRRGPYAYAYVYLSEPLQAAPSPAPAATPRCRHCGGQAGEVVRVTLPGPDDGGDVAGRTPAGSYHEHTDPDGCEAHRAASVAARREALAAWITTAPVLAVVDTIDETDSVGSPLPRDARTLGSVEVVTVRRPWPLRPTVYRPRPDGRYDVLGELPAARA